MTRTRKAAGPEQPPYRSIASQMTPAHHQAVRLSADAELRGDAAAALELHRSVRMFVSSTHGDRLEQLAELGEAAPPWLISRWLTIQARRRMWTGSSPHEKQLKSAMEFAIGLVYPHGIRFETIGCDYVEQVMPHLGTLDWVVRQVDLYELGALRELVRHHASPELLERAEPTEGWRRAAMGGYRLLGGDDDIVRVLDLGTGEPLELLDLGLAEWLEPGATMLGRVVPTASGLGRMFEWRPLPIDEETAAAVARRPRAWLPILADRAAARRLPDGFSMQSESSIITDLPLYSWLSLLGRGKEERPEWPDRAGLALDVALKLAATDEPAARGHRHMVSDLLVDLDLSDRALRRLATTEHAAGWAALERMVGELARRRCAEMSMWAAAEAEAS